MSIILPVEFYIGFSIRHNTESKEYYKLAYLVENGTSESALKAKANVDAWSKDKNIYYTNPPETPEPIVSLNNPANGYSISNMVFRRSYWGDDKTIWQITDPRGFDFQISSSNMANIMQTCTVINGVIQENCVLGISNKNVVLLPINSEPYLEAIGTTDIRNKPLIKMSELKKGDVVRLKRGITVIYFGYYHYIGKRNSYSDTTIVCGEKKCHFYAEYDEETKDVKKNCYTESNQSQLDVYEIIDNVDIPIKLDGYVGNSTHVLGISDKRIKISYFEIVQAGTLVKTKALTESKIPHNQYFKSNNTVYKYDYYSRLHEIHIDGAYMNSYSIYQQQFNINEIDFIDIFVYTLCNQKLKV